MSSEDALIGDVKSQIRMILYGANRSSEYIPFSEVYPCLALGCLTSSCYVTHPDWLGCTNRATCCCIRNETLLFKPGREEDSRCTVVDTKLDIADCRLLLKCQSQVCCEDVRLSIPPDDRDAPCLCTIFFITVYFKDHCTLSFCRNGGDLDS
eukprot:gene8682-9565_t